MKTKQLGSKGPDISVIGFGAWEMGGAHWGPNPEEKQMIDAVHAGADAGMTWIDTAEVYGNGVSEEIIGRAVKGRSDLLVFTKVAPKPAGTGFAPEQVKEACEKSLTRLGTAAIDLFQLHWPDANAPLADTWGAMAALVDAGKVRYIGVSNFDQAQIETCEKIRHVDSLQPPFSLLDGRFADLIAWCGTNGTGVISYGPLAYGLLTGAITMETTFHDQDWRAGKIGIGGYDRLFAPAAREKALAVVDQLRPIADRIGISLALLVLAWNVQQSGVTGAIAGSRSAKHTSENASAGDVTLSEKDLEEIASVLG